MLTEPTVAAIILADPRPEAALALLTRAMGDKGYARRDAPPPSGYPRAEGEWVGVWVGTAGQLALLVPEDVSLVFRLACWLSAAAEGGWLAAVRRYMGSAPALKLYTAGGPRWRDGDDPDLEVDWHVPTARPVDVPEPARVGLPSSADDAVRRAGAVLAPWRVLAAREGAVVTGWIAQDSPLTRR
ncbi:MAG: hypothetical protein R3F39_21975 [Myxococcota bacterium]